MQKKNENYMKSHKNKIKNNAKKEKYMKYSQNTIKKTQKQVPNESFVG